MSNARMEAGFAKLVKQSEQEAKKLIWIKKAAKNECNHRQMLRKKQENSGDKPHAEFNNTKTEQRKETSWMSRKSKTWESWKKI